MKLQVLQDGFGNSTGVYLPMNDIPKAKNKKSELAGLLSSETANAMLKEVEENRKNRDERLNKQF